MFSFVLTNYNSPIVIYYYVFIYTVYQKKMRTTVFCSLQYLHNFNKFKHIVVILASNIVNILQIYYYKE